MVHQKVRHSLIWGTCDLTYTPAVVAHTSNEALMWIFVFDTFQGKVFFSHHPNVSSISTLSTHSG